MAELPSHIVEALEDLKESEIENASINALKIRAWLYLIRFLSSFNYFYEKKNPYSSILLSPQQASIFAFGIDDNNDENFLFYAQESDYWWLNEIQIEFMTFIDNFLIIKFPPLDYENLNIKSDNKISIKSLTISIPLSEMYIDHLKESIPKFKTVYLGSIKKSISGFNKLEIVEHSNRAIPIKHQVNALTRQHFKSNSSNFL